MFRLLLFYIWAGLLFIFTCTADLSQFLLHQTIEFHFNSRPNLMDFFLPLPNELDYLFIKSKIGHILFFFIFSSFIYISTFSMKKMILVSYLYAGGSEVLQLFFERGGRLFDIGFDSFGILGAVLIISSSKIFQHHNRRAYKDT